MKLWTKVKNVQRSNFERKMRSQGYWPGMETTQFRLWWNDDDDMVVEEKKEELE